MIEKGLFKFCGNTKKYIWQAVMINCLRLLANISFSYLLAYLLVGILEGNKTINIYPILGAMVVLLAIRQFCIKLVGDYNTKVISEVKHNLRKEIYGKILRLGNSYQQELSTQEIVHLGVEGVEQLENYYGGYLTQFYYCFISSLVLFVAVLPFNFIVALTLLIFTPIIPLSLQMVLKMVKKSQKEYWESYADVGNLFLDSLQGLTTLKIFDADKKKSDDMANISELFRIYTMNLLKSQLKSIAIIDWIAYGGSSIGIIVAITQFAKGNMSLYGLVLVIMMAAEFFVPMKALTSLFHVAMTGVTAGDRMLEFLEKEEPARSGKEKLNMQTNLLVKDLEYIYPDGTKALDKINMVIKPGNLTAIVGPSGCGKSTLASILSGQYLPAKNQIFIGTNEYFEVLSKDIETKITRITHDGHLFIGTVRDNLLMGHKDACEKEMIEVLEHVKMWDYLKTMNGLDTEILSGGKNLSGGQAQRISLARALLHDSEIYIFDEATSNIDVESEEIILKVIEDIAKLRTVVYISHRLQSIKNADKIYVMNKGNVIEEGNHNELMNNKGLYYDLFTEQEELESFRHRVVVGGEA